VTNARRLVWLFTSLCLAGCYTFQPARQTTFVPGTVIALDLNDNGRAALGGTIGPEISRIEGNVVSMDANEYVLHVTGVHFLRGGEQAWRGEMVHIKTDFVSSRFERQFSTGRTLVLGAIAVGAIAAVAASGLVGFGTGDGGNPGKGDTSAVTSRIPRKR
jgi:hypothetical protein